MTDGTQKVIRKAERVLHVYTSDDALTTPEPDRFLLVAYVEGGD